ncbi:Ig domain-containing protein [Labilibacter sediminis]|nr:Ig domain-containing protein [Labilibacter sediminis]
MKTKSLLLVAVLFAFIFASCSSDDKKEDPNIDVTGISVDQETLSVEVESTATLVASLAPAGATGDVSWSSSDPSVASVNNGVIIGLKTGEATIAASHGAFSASCVITVTPKTIDPEDLPASLKGSNYHVVHMDGISFEYISDKVVNDFRPDEENKFLYVWENTFSAGTSSGLNFYGQAEGWISLVVGSVGWSGAGYNVATGYGDIDMTDLYANPEDYYFHAAFKSASESSYLLIFEDGASAAKVCIGSSDFNDAGTIFPAYADFTRDNEWHSVEIPVTKLKELGLFYNDIFQNKNVLSFLAGGVSGTTFDMDAAFFYKKAE